MSFKNYITVGFSQLVTDPIYLRALAQYLKFHKKNFDLKCRYLAGFTCLSV